MRHQKNVSAEPTASESPEQRDFLRKAREDRPTATDPTASCLVLAFEGPPMPRTLLENDGRMFNLFAPFDVNLGG